MTKPVKDAKNELENCNNFVLVTDNDTVIAPNEEDLREQLGLLQLATYVLITTSISQREE